MCSKGATPNTIHRTHVTAFGVNPEDLAPEAQTGNSEGEYEPNFVTASDAASTGKRGEPEAALADIPVTSALLARIRSFYK